MEEKEGGDYSLIKSSGGRYIVRETDREKEEKVKLDK